VIRFWTVILSLSSFFLIDCADRGRHNWHRTLVLSEIPTAAMEDASSFLSRSTWFSGSGGRRALSVILQRL